MVSTNKPKRVQRFGPELWEQRAGYDWSLWDLWFCVIVVGDHGGDLHDLQARLADAGLTAGDLVDDAVLADKRIAARGREKVTGRIGLEGRAPTPVMIATPRRRLEQRARYGHWPEFPSDPAPFFEKFRPTVERVDHITKGKTFAVVARLEKRLASLDRPCQSLPDRLALYRAFLTAGLELADASDDSYGNIGQARADAWDTYLSIDWRSTGMNPAAYWQDLCELPIWEPYGLDFQHEADWVRSARTDEAPVVESILLALEREHYDAVLDYPAEDALIALSDL